uniref:thiolase family protein n=1 Tax=Rhodococcus erythropolis TaxID=1833 RepID=UPI000BB31DB1
MAGVFIINAVRTIVGRRYGGLADLHLADLEGAALVERVNIKPSLAKTAICGCFGQTGQPSRHVARTSWLATGSPESIPGVTTYHQSGSSQQVARFVTQAMLSETQNLIVAGDLQNMSSIRTAASPGRSRALLILLAAPSAGAFAMATTSSRSSAAGSALQKWGSTEHIWRSFHLRVIACSSSHRWETARKIVSAAEDM